jgi:alkaline phosphatase
MNERSSLTRRAVLQRGSAVLAGTAGLALTACVPRTGEGRPAPEPLKIGLVTDVHYADKDTAGSRNYRGSLEKLAGAVARFNEIRTDFVVELGDLVDAAQTVERETAWLDRIEAGYARVRCPRHHVLGNHCVYTLTKAQFQARCGMSRSFYSFDSSGFHFVVLDACFRADGVPYGNRNFDWKEASIPAAELEWLEADLKTAARPSVVFVHQRLDVDDAHGVANRVEVRRRLEASGRVLAVFQGHNHVNDLREINGVAYCTLPAMVEGDTNAFAVAFLKPSGAIRVEGFGRQSEWSINT